MGKVKKRKAENFSTIPTEKMLNELMVILGHPSNLVLMLFLNNVYISSLLLKTFIYFSNVGPG